MYVSLAIKMALNNKRCRKCSKVVEEHVTCFKCDAVYHKECVSEMSGRFANKEGYICCCSNVTSKYSEPTENIAAQNSTEQFTKDLENRRFTEQEPAPKLDTYRIKEENNDFDDSRAASVLKQEITYKCNPCCLNYEDEKYFSGHHKCPYKTEESTELSNNKDVFVCTFCKIEFCKEADYQGHERMCGKRENTENNYAGKRKPVLENVESSDTKKPKSNSNCHNVIRGSQKKFECPTCEKSFKYKRNLNDHVKTHDKEREKVTCSYCNKSYTRKNTLMDHIKTKHSDTDEKPFRCTHPHCNYTAVLPTYLARHVKNSHTPKDPLKFDEHTEYSRIPKNPLECDKNTKCRRALKDPLEFDEYDYHCYQKFNLKNHVKENK